MTQNEITTATASLTPAQLQLELLRRALDRTNRVIPEINLAIEHLHRKADEALHQVVNLESKRLRQERELARQLARLDSPKQHHFGYPDCLTCVGKGVLPYDPLIRAEYVTCPDCKGSGVNTGYNP